MWFIVLGLFSRPTYADAPAKGPVFSSFESVDRCVRGLKLCLSVILFLFEICAIFQARAVTRPGPPAAQTCGGVVWGGEGRGGWLLPSLPPGGSHFLRSST